MEINKKVLVGAGLILFTGTIILSHTNAATFSSELQNTHKETLDDCSVCSDNTKKCPSECQSDQTKFTKCEGMEYANVSHVTSGDTVTLKWNAIEGNNVEISIYNPSTETYKSLGTVKMSSKKFTYKVKWEGEQIFKLSNGCNEFIYKVSVSSITKPNNLIDDSVNKGNETDCSVCSDNTKKCPSECQSDQTKFTKCEGMEYANVSHVTSGDTVTLKWNAIEGNNVEISIYNPSTETYKSLGTVKMSSKKFTYKVKWEGEQIFKLSNGCNEYIYKVDYNSTLNTDKSLNILTGIDCSACSLNDNTKKCPSECLSDQTKFTKCEGMEYANVSHVTSGDTVTLKWNAIEGNNVEISIYNPSTETYKSLGTVKMSSKNFTYKVKWEGEQIFKLSNGCNEFIYKVDIKLNRTEDNLKVIEEEKTDKEKKAEEKTIEKNKSNTISAQITINKKTNYDNGNPSEVLSNGYTREMNNAFKFAHDNGITTTNSIEKARVNSSLTRIAMAKMLSNYAINVLGKEPDISKGIVDFNDVTRKMNKDYGNAVTLAYQLGIMGQNIKSNNFRPNDEVTRAEFASALSRMLYSTSDGNPYYTSHLNKLKKEGIISKDNPKAIEKRGYVMLMLMRATDQ